MQRTADQILDVEEARKDVGGIERTIRTVTIFFNGRPQTVVYQKPFPQVIPVVD